VAEAASHVPSRLPIPKLEALKLPKLATRPERKKRCELTKGRCAGLQTMECVPSTSPFMRSKALHSRCY
jgi:hypothetical protein